MLPSSTPPSNLQLPTPTAPTSQADPLLVELHRLQGMNSALSIALWTLVRKHCPETHTADVAITPDDPLWELVFGPSDLGDGHMHIMAGEKLPPTEGDKKRLVRLLRGTSRDLMEAMQEIGLDYPPSYMEQAISAHLVWHRESQVWQGLTQITEENAPSA